MTSLDPSTIAAVQAAVRQAKASGWDQTQLKLWFTAQGIGHSAYSVALAGGPIVDDLRSTFASLSIIGLPDQPPGSSNVSVALPGPDRLAILAHLEHLFGELPFSQEGLVEVAWTAAQCPHGLNQARLFDSADLDEIADEIVARNSLRNQNGYLSAGLRRADTAREQRAADCDVTHLTAIWADFDDEGAADAARAAVEAWGMPPTFVVQTASKLYTRAQFWWRLDEPTDQIGRAGEIMKALARTLGGDRSVFNPSRVMRVGGSVAWPLKNGRTLEGTQILADWATRKVPYSIDEIERAVRANAPEVADAAPGALRQALDSNETERRSQQARFAMTYQPGGWHAGARDYIASMIQGGASIETVLALAPALQREGYTLAQTEREVRTLAEGAWAKFQPVSVEASGDVIEPESGEVIAERPARKSTVLDPWERWPVPSFPLDCLPPVLQRFTRYTAQSVGCDPASVAMAALAVCSGAIDQRFSLKMKRTGQWYARPRLWVVLVGDPSAKKSPIMSACVDPLQAEQAKLLERHRRDMAAWKAAKTSGEVGPEPERPTRYIVDDITPETVGEILSHQDRGALSLRDELSAWIGSMDKYSGGKGSAADRGFWLQAYNGGPKTVDRISRGTIVINNLCVAFLGAIQPERLAEIGNLTSDGLLQRFVPVMMAPATYSAEVDDDAPAAEYRQLVQSLAAQPAHGLVMDDAGRAAVAEFERSLFDISTMDGFGKGFSSFIGKLSNVQGALIIVLHLASNPGEARLGAVPERVVRAAERIIQEFIIPHALELYRTTTDAGDWEDLRATASFILTQDRDRLTPSDFTSGVRGLRGLGQWHLNQKLSPLVTGGWLAEDAPNGALKAWIVQPGLREAMADRRESEIARKADATDRLKILKREAAHGKAA